MKQTNPSDTLVKEIFIECRPQTLFSFFTEPDKMVRWIGRHILLEPRIGGKYRIDINGNDLALGEYVEIVPYEKIVLTWGWDQSEIMPPGSSTVELGNRSVVDTSVNQHLYKIGGTYNDVEHHSSRSRDQRDPAASLRSTYEQ